MMKSPPGQGGPRLRAKRVRSGRPVRPSEWFAPAVFVLLSVLGFLTASVLGFDLRLPSVSLPTWSPPPTLPTTSSNEPPPAESNPEIQVYLQSLATMHKSLQQNVLRMGLAVASAQTGDVDRRELNGQLEDGLAAYRRIEEQVRGLEPPPELQRSHDRYVSTIRLFEQSTTELLQADGNPGADPAQNEHLTRAVSLNIEAVGRLSILGDQLWPTLN